MSTARLLITCLILTAIPAIAQEGVPPEQPTHGAEKPEHQAAHPEEAHGEGHAPSKTYFGIPGWILKLINMILFFGLLIFLLRGPVGNAIRGRGSAIQQQLAEARERRQKADQLAEEIRGRLSRLEGDVATILKRAEEEGERQKQELIAAANEEAEKILRSARSEVDARVKQARKELTDYAGELAAQRAQQILAESLTEGDRRKLFDESVRNITEKSS